MSEDNPELICPSCMWQGDNDDTIGCPYCNEAICPKCHNELQTMEEYKEQEVSNYQESYNEDE